MAEKENSAITQYLTFTLGDEFFAQEIAEVREVLEYTTITQMPGTPDYLLGVINLRGEAVPVVDMRLKLGMKQKERTVNTSIIITEVDLNKGKTIIGALVDSVKEVLEMDQQSLEAPPKIGTQMNIDFIKSMGKQDDKFVMILDVERIFSTDELNYVNQVTEALVDETKPEEVVA